MGSLFINVKNDLLLAEGEYANSKDDLGFETKYGVSKREYPALNIKDLSFESACEILEKDYWDRYRMSEISVQPIANKIFLMLINMNPIRAGECVQRAINMIAVTPLLIDGVIGSKTIATINDVAFTYPEWSLDALRVELCRLYLKRVDANTSQLSNLRGWIRRALT